MSAFTTRLFRINFASSGMNFYLGGGFKVHLFQNDLTPDADTVLADFTECDFDGYTPADWTGDFSTVVGDPDDSLYFDGNGPYPSRFFLFTAGGGLVSPQTAYGWFATGGSSPPFLLTYGRFAIPQIVVLPGDVSEFKLSVRPHTC